MVSLRLWLGCDSESFDRRTPSTHRGVSRNRHAHDVCRFVSVNRVPPEVSITYVWARQEIRISNVMTLRERSNEVDRARRSFHAHWSGFGGVSLGDLSCDRGGRSGDCGPVERRLPAR